MEQIYIIFGIFAIITGLNFKLFYSKVNGKKLEGKLDLLLKHFGLLE